MSNRLPPASWLWIQPHSVPAPPPPRGKLLTPPRAPLPSSLISKTPVGRTSIYYWL